MRAHNLKWVLSGDARITDNIACATLYFVRGTVESVTDQGALPLDVMQQAAVGELGCAVSHALAGLIHEPATWRIAGLVSTARLLSKHVGLDAAARVAATAARDFSKRLKTGHPDANAAWLASLAARVVESDDPVLLQQAIDGIEQRLATVPLSQRSGVAQS